MYQNWEEAIIEAFEWYPVQDIIRHLHELRRFIIRTQGAFAITYLPKLIGNEDTNGMYTLPASKIRRFPAKQEYLCEAIGEWGIIKDKLELVADVLCHPNRINRNYPKFDTQGEAEEYAFELVNQLLQKIENRKDVVNQSIFEERYGLKWIEEDQVQEDREEQTLVVLEDGQRSTDREDHDKQTSSNGVPNIAENSL